MQDLVVNDLVEYCADKRVRKALLKTDHLICEMVCYEPGQSTASHHHPSQDEIFYIVEGAGVVTVEDERIPVGPSSMVMIPAQKRHGVEASADSRLVILFVKAPGMSIFAVRGAASASA